MFNHSICYAPVDDYDNEGARGGSAMRDSNSDAESLGLNKRRGGKKRAPDFMSEPEFEFDYKDPQQLKFFLTDRGKIVPRRISGLSAKQQRQVTIAIRRARNIALLPYTQLR